MLTEGTLPAGPLVCWVCEPDRPGVPSFCSLSCRRQAIPCRQQLLRVAVARLREGSAAGEDELLDHPVFDELRDLTTAVVTFAAVHHPPRGPLTGVAPELPGLSFQQWLTVLFVGDGLTNNEVARVLGLSVHTVRNYLATAMHRLGLVTRTEVVALVVEMRTLVEHAPSALGFGSASDLPGEGVEGERPGLRLTGDHRGPRRGHPNVEATGA
jgi:hypothetical protein